MAEVATTADGGSTLTDIEWTDAHGEKHHAFRSGSGVARFIAELYHTPGCEFVSAAPGQVSGR